MFLQLQLCCLQKLMPQFAAYSFLIKVATTTVYLVVELFIEVLPNVR